MEIPRIDQLLRLVCDAAAVDPKSVSHSAVPLLRSVTPGGRHHR